MAEQAPGGITYDGAQRKLGMSDESVRELGAVVKHVVDRVADSFDRHPVAAVFIVGFVLLGLAFQAWRQSNRVRLNRDLKPLRHAPAPKRGHGTPPPLPPPAPRSLPRGDHDGT